MFEYAVYIRTTRGYIERTNRLISNPPCDPQETYRSLAPYVHEEELVGFPEPVVFWDNRTGLSVGIAPINPPSRPTDSAPASTLLGG